jgi:hypothetical protein
MKLSALYVVYLQISALVISILHTLVKMKNVHALSYVLAVK